MRVNKKYSNIPKLVIICIFLFIIKNIYSCVMNQLEIRHLKKELSYEKKVNLDLINEIKTIKTDSYVIRYAVDNLNLKPADDDIVDLKITDEELNEIKLRMELGIFGKKFENIETPKQNELDNNNADSNNVVDKVNLDNSKDSIIEDINLDNSSDN